MRWTRMEDGWTRTEGYAVREEEAKQRCKELPYLENCFHPSSGAKETLSMCRTMAKNFRLLRICPCSLPISTFVHAREC